MTQQQRIAVVGGGVAGIAAAVSLADAGLRVELFEKRPMLGGRASSWIDNQTGERHDACQHGTMRCCTNLADLLERLGVHDQIRYHDALYFLDGDGRRSVIRGGPLPAPLHTALSFLRFGSLGLRDKAAIARGMLAMLRAGERPEHEAESIGAWFRRMGQTERAVRRFWEPVLVSACNESLDRISATHAFKIFRDGFLANSRGFEFGVPRVPLGTLYTEPTVAYLERRGGCVHLKTTVDRFLMDDGRISGLALQDGSVVEADHTVSALQQDLLLKILPSDATAGVPYFENLRKMEVSPIIGIHFWFDRPIDCPEALALLDTKSHWVFNKNLNFDQGEGEGTYLSVVISASREIAAMDKEQVREVVLEELRAALPQARDARVVKSFVLKEKKATFSPVPGVEAWRPLQRSPIPSLYVAGEWTRTGWPSTMESAARSGYLVAEAVLEDATMGGRYLVPDLPRTGLSRWLMP
jgi:zeta-carotene desaturase